MNDETVRARYTYHPVLAVMALLFAAPIAFPVVARLTGQNLPWWVLPAAIVVAVPTVWAWALFRVVYRLELTGTHLRLRAPLWTKDVPLTELREISTAANGKNLAKIRYGDGHSRTLLAGPGLMNFLERVRQAAPQARIEVSAMTRANERLSRFFSADADPDR